MKRKEFNKRAIIHVLGASRGVRIIFCNVLPLSPSTQNVCILYTIIKLRYGHMCHPDHEDRNHNMTHVY